VWEILTVAHRTCSILRCTEVPYARLLVQPAERGKPVALSASESGTESPKRKCGERGSGERTGRKRRLDRNSGDRGSNFAPRRKAADFPGG
jgi:hypothetical protein